MTNWSIIHTIQLHYLWDNWIFIYFYSTTQRERGTLSYRNLCNISTQKTLYLSLFIIWFISSPLPLKGSSHTWGILVDGSIVNSPRWNWQRWSPQSKTPHSLPFCLASQNLALCCVPFPWCILTKWLPGWEKQLGRQHVWLSELESTVMESR